MLAAAGGSTAMLPEKVLPPKARVFTASAKASCASVNSKVAELLAGVSCRNRSLAPVILPMPPSDVDGSCKTM